MNNQDRLPQDGWELLRYELGYNENGTPKTTAVDFIHIVLYNKYTGILRVFFAGNRSQSYSGAKIEIRFQSGTQSSALSNASRLFALDSFEQNPGMTAVSEYNNASSKWFYADFNMGYDPCTCIYESSMVIQLRLINNSVINLGGTQTGTLTNITSNSGSVSDNSYSFSPKFTNVSSNIIQAAHKSYKTITSFTQDQLTAIQDTVALAAQPAHQAALSLFQQALVSSSFLRNGLKAIPFLSTAVSFFDFFISGGKDSGPQEVKIMPMALNSTITLKGTLESSSLYGNITFYTPGSLNAHTKNPVDYPYYNEVLGVFNLLETPKIYYKNLQSTHTTWPGGTYDNAERNQYQSAGIKYMVNPAARFSTDNVEIMASLDFGSFQTQFMPLSALSSFSVETGFASSYDGQQYYSSVLGSADGAPIAIKLLVNLERLNAGPNTQNVLIVARYPVSNVLNSSFSYSPTYGSIPDNVTIAPNQTIGYDVYAWNNITVSSNANFTGTRVLKANDVVLKEGAVIPANVSIQIGLPNGLFAPI